MGATNEILREMTADELREMLGVKVRAFQIRWKNEFAQPYAKDQVATTE